MWQRTGRGREGGAEGTRRGLGGEKCPSNTLASRGRKAGRGVGCVILRLALAQEPALLVVKSKCTREEGLMRSKCGRGGTNAMRKGRGKEGIREQI